MSKKQHSNMLQTALFLGSQTSFHGITYLIKYKILS